MSAVSERLAFRCAHRGGRCDCDESTCTLDRALCLRPPACTKCGRTMALHDRFTFDHEPADDPGVTMQLVEALEFAKRTGMETMIGAEVIVYYCEP